MPGDRDLIALGELGGEPLGKALEGDDLDVEGVAARRPWTASQNSQTSRPGIPSSSGSESSVPKRLTLFIAQLASPSSGASASSSVPASIAPIASPLIGQASSSRAWAR